jgi:hypothetical protein
MRGVQERNGGWKTIAITSRSYSETPSTWVNEPAWLHSWRLQRDPCVKSTVIKSWPKLKVCVIFKFHCRNWSTE